MADPCPIRSSSRHVQTLRPVAELARAGNVPPRRLLRLLRYNGIPVLRAGRACYVCLDEIRRRIPSLYRSLRIVEALRRGPIREDASGTNHREQLSPRVGGENNEVAAPCRLRANGTEITVKDTLTRGKVTRSPGKVSRSPGKVTPSRGEVASSPEEEPFSTGEGPLTSGGEPFSVIDVPPTRENVTSPSGDVALIDEEVTSFDEKVTLIDEQEPS